MKTTNPLQVTFRVGDEGAWTVRGMTTLRGAGLPDGPRLEMEEGFAPLAPGSIWKLRGVTSNARYTTRSEAAALTAIQPSLGRLESTCAALIPIRKSLQWWSMAQDERRSIYEERSRHTTIGLTYLPRIARRLHHSRDLGEPFDFLTWFEFAPQDEPAFDELLGKLRSSEEWRFVEREVDIRLTR